MSVTTRADSLRDEAKNHIDDAIRTLQQCATDGGFEDYRDEYQNNILDVGNELLKLKRKL